MQSRMRLTFAVAALVPSVALAQAPATSATALTPPVAAVRPQRFDEHGNVRIDPYYWLKDRNNPEVIKYLEDENAYTKAVMAHTEALQERLYEELKGRVLQNDQSVPFREGNYFYYTRFVERARRDHDRCERARRRHADVPHPGVGRQLRRGPAGVCRGHYRRSRQLDSVQESAHRRNASRCRAARHRWHRLGRG